MNLATGQNLIKQKKYPSALKLFKYLLKLNPNKYEIYFYLGRIYSELQDIDNSIYFYNKYLEYNGNSIGCLLNLAVLYLNIGDKIRSAENFKKVIKKNKNYVYAYYGLFSLSKNFLKDKDFNHLSKILINYKTSSRDKSLINFIFSKREKNNDNIKKELFFLEQYHNQSFQSNLLYNKQSQFYYEKILEHINEKVSFINDDNYYKKAKPIFIVGLPRSGSTLVESLISSGKNKVRSYGESNYFNIAVFDQIKNKIFNKEFNIKKANISIDIFSIIESINERYELNNKFEDKKIFLDKSLENIFNIEIILKVFPNAKFIHTKRNLNDAKLSIYFSMLPELSWTLSLKTINHYVEIYQKRISYYKKKFPGKIFEIDLDDLTINSEKISKDMYKFCDLNWSKEILNFFKRKDLFTKTLSSSQIRNEISEKNQSKYDKYYFLLKET